MLPKSRRHPALRLLIAINLLCLCGWFAAAFAQQPAVPKKIWDGVFTPTQAARGKDEFDRTCSRCHNLALIGSERGPAIKGTSFLEHYERGSVADLFIKIRDTMPEGNAGVLNEDAKIDILTYILQQNGFPEGPAELSKDVSQLSDIRMAKKGIWDGVFTEAQAERGKQALSENGCNGCHGAELEGDRGPSLKGDRFVQDWGGGSVSKLFAKIRDTMPPFNPEQVAPAAKADIVAYLLRVNGFPAGASDLPPDVAALDGFQIVPQNAELAEVPNFSLVRTVGCLEPATDGRWKLARASDPAATKEEAPTPASLKEAGSTPLGAASFDLVSVSRRYQAESHRGHKMEARGLLYRDAAYSEINLTSLSMLSIACGN